MLLTIIILYLQSFLGARFMLPLKYQKKELYFYKSRDELLKEKPESRNEECAICLLPIIEKEEVNDNQKEIDNSSNLEVKIDNNNTNTSKADISLDTFTQEEINNKNNVENIDCGKKSIHILKREKKKNKVNLYNFIIKFGKIIKSIILDGLFMFYKGKPIFHKAFISLPCGHFFHSICLENWLGVRKECPICRSSVSQYF
jgi:hypothetical protein